MRANKSTFSMTLLREVQMRISVFVLIALLIGTQSSLAGGGRLFSSSGNPGTTPTQLTTTRNMREVVADATIVFENGQQILAQLLSGVEIVAKRQPPENATELQRRDLANEKFTQMQAVLEPYAGRAISISIKIEDIIRRSPPIEPTAPHPNDPGVNFAHYQAQLSQYRAALAIFEEQKFLIVARIRIQGRPVDQRISSQIGIAAKEHRKHIETLLDGLKKASAERRKSIMAQKRSIELAHKARLVELRKRMADSQLGNHYGYFLSSDPRLTEWRRGQTRSVKAFIQTAALFQNRYSDLYMPGMASAQSSGTPRTPNATESAKDTGFVNELSPSFSAELILHMVQDDGAQADAPVEIDVSTEDGSGDDTGGDTGDETGVGTGENIDDSTPATESPAPGESKR